MILKFSLLFVWLLPWVYWLSNKEERKELLVLLKGVAISVGMGSLVVYYFYLLGAGTYDGWLPVIFVATMLLGVMLGRGIMPSMVGVILSGVLGLGRMVKKLFGLGITSLLSWFIALRLVHMGTLSLLTPFVHWDDLARYAFWGSRTFALKQITEELVIWPLLMPMSYTYAFVSSGYVNEYLAKVVVLIVSLGGLTYVYAIAKRWWGNLAGLIAVGIMVSLESYMSWLRFGYVDVATAFFMLGGLYQTILLIERPTLRDSLWVGLWIGLALWTKHAALTFLASFAGLVIASRLGFTQAPKLPLKYLWAVFFVCGLIMVPWFVRSYLIAGMIVVDTPALSQISLRFLAPWMQGGENWVISLLMSLGFIGLLVLSFKKERRGLPINQLTTLGAIVLMMGYLGYRIGTGLAANSIPDWYLGGGVLTIVLIFAVLSKLEGIRYFVLTNRLGLLLLFVVPYFWVWWTGFALEPRYLVTIEPLVVLAATGVLARFGSWIEDEGVKAITILLGACLLIWPTLKVSNVVLTQDWWKQTLEASEFDRRKEYIAETYRTGQFLDQVGEPGERISCMDNRLSFFAPKLTHVNNAPRYLSDLIGYKYFCYLGMSREWFPTRGVPKSEVLDNLKNEELFKSVYRSEMGGYEIFELRYSDSDFKKVVEQIIAKPPEGPYVHIDEIYFPSVLPGSKKYILKRIQEIFSKDEVNKITKRVLEARVMCLDRDLCNESKIPLDEFKDGLAKFERLDKQQQMRVIDLLPNYLYALKEIESKGGDTKEAIEIVIRVWEENNSRLVLAN